MRVTRVIPGPSLSVNVQVDNVMSHQPVWPSLHSLHSELHFLLHQASGMECRLPFSFLLPPSPLQEDAATFFSCLIVTKSLMVLPAFDILPEKSRILSLETPFSWRILSCCFFFCVCVSFFRFVLRRSEGQRCNPVPSCSFLKTIRLPILEFVDATFNTRLVGAECEDGRCQDFRVTYILQSFLTHFVQYLWPSISKISPSLPPLEVHVQGGFEETKMPFHSTSR